MLQILDQALAEPGNKTRFTLIYANVSPKDILLKEQFDSLRAKYPDTFSVVYTVDKADSSWKGLSSALGSRPLVADSYLQVRPAMSIRPLSNSTFRQHPWARR